MHLHSFVLCWLDCPFIFKQLWIIFKTKYYFQKNYRNGAIFKQSACRGAILQKRLKTTELEAEPNTDSVRIAINKLTDVNHATTLVSLLTWLKNAITVWGTLRIFYCWNFRKRVQCPRNMRGVAALNLYKNNEVWGGLQHPQRPLQVIQASHLEFTSLNE